MVTVTSQKCFWKMLKNPCYYFTQISNRIKCSNGSILYSKGQHLLDFLMLIQSISLDIFRHNSGTGRSTVTMHHIWFDASLLPTLKHSWMYRPSIELKMLMNSHLFRIRIFLSANYLNKKRQQNSYKEFDCHCVYFPLELHWSIQWEL